MRKNSCSTQKEVENILSELRRDYIGVEAALQFVWEEICKYQEKLNDILIEKAAKNRKRDKKNRKSDDNN